MHTAHQRRQSGWPTTRITLLQRVADQHDHRSWECFVNIYGPLIYRYSQRRGLQESDAMDVVQDVLLQVSQAMSGFRYDVERGRFRNWLGAVTHRAMLKHVAKSRRSRGLTMGNWSSSPSSPDLECPQSLDEVWVETFNAHLYREAVKSHSSSLQRGDLAGVRCDILQESSPQPGGRRARSHRWLGVSGEIPCAAPIVAEIMNLAEDSVLLNPPSQR